MKLVLQKSDVLEDWYLIEKSDDDHEHIREMRPVSFDGMNVLSLYDSARISDACVEGTATEMRDIAYAIEHCECESFKRCAVDARTDQVHFWSPRNSSYHGIVSREAAEGLAKMIREMLPEDK